MSPCQGGVWEGVCVVSSCLCLCLVSGVEAGRFFTPPGIMSVSVRLKFSGHNFPREEGIKVVSLFQPPAISILDPLIVVPFVHEAKLLYVRPPPRPVSKIEASLLPTPSY